MTKTIKVSNLYFIVCKLGGGPVFIRSFYSLIFCALLSLSSFCYVMDITPSGGGKFNGIFGSNFTTPEEAFSLKISFGDKTIISPTHLFKVPPQIVPYSNYDGGSTADGKTFERGDEEIAKIFNPGQIGIAVKHHRSEYPRLDLNSGRTSDMKENFKLQDSHIEIVVGVKRDGKNGAITINNPQSYESGLFGAPNYPMIFLRPVYPEFLKKYAKDFENNIRTMLVGFNAVTTFPGDYNGGDPLGARDPDHVREYVKNMVVAIGGVERAAEEAKAWFHRSENQVYCAELAFISYSAGLLVPLNDATMVPLVGAEVWKRFKEHMIAHNKGLSSPFSTLNSNKRVMYIRDLVPAPSKLKPAGSYAPSELKNALALQPLTVADIIEEFIRVTLPREQFGEDLAPIQGAVLASMKENLMSELGMNNLPSSDPVRMAAEQLFNQLVQTVSKKYASYNEFRQVLGPLLLQARKLSGPRDSSGVGLFVPPSLFHVAAQGRKTGLISFQYVGHGVHFSAVRSSP